MVPKNIEHRHVERALRAIDQDGVPPRREARGYVLLQGAKRYPPKYVLALANSYANGQELDPQDHSGGAETNTLLCALGFRVEAIVPPKPNLQYGAKLQTTTPRASVRVGARAHTVATVVVCSDGSYDERARLDALETVISATAARITGPALVLFPGGWFKAGPTTLEVLLSRLEPRVSAILRRVGGARFSISMGVDGRRGPRGTPDQLAVVMTTSGMVAMGRKFYPAPRETINAANPWDVGESGLPRIAEIDGRRYFLAVCYDGFGIKHGRLVRPNANAVLDHVHGFLPKGEGGSGDVFFARHGFAGAAQTWGVPVFGAAVFFRRSVPSSWPSGVTWKGPPRSTTEWRYGDNGLQPKDTFSVEIHEGSADVRVFSW